MKQGMTIEQLSDELIRQKTVKHDYVVDTRRVHFFSDEKGSVIDLLGEGADEHSSDLKVTDLCHKQIGSHLRIPRPYYDRMRAENPKLLDINVMTWMQDEAKASRRLLRTMDGNARAFLSDRYRRRDNDELARHLLPILSRIQDVRFESVALTDRRMYIKALAPRVVGQVKVGTDICAGVYISNSEVGEGALEIYPFVYTLACSNGMVVKNIGKRGMMRKVHVGRAIPANEASYAVFSDKTLELEDQTFFSMCADIVSAAVDEVNFRDLCAQMAKAAMDQPMENPVAGIAVLANRAGLSEEEGQDVLKYLSAGGDITRWGVLSAVTRTAEDVDDYDRATELETLGGDILEYDEKDWRPIATAV